MDPFTVFLVIAGPLVLLAIAVHEVRNWRKPGPRKLPHIDDSDQANQARFRSSAHRIRGMGDGGFGAGS